MKPTIKREHCEHLAHLLSDGQWHHRRNLRMTNRTIRGVCAEQPDRFLSSQKGYKLVRFATIGEIDIAVADLRSRIKHMTARAEALANAKYIRSTGTEQITQQSALL